MSVDPAGLFISCGQLWCYRSFQSKQRAEKCRDLWRKIKGDGIDITIEYALDQWVLKGRMQTCEFAEFLCVEEKKYAKQSAARGSRRSVVA